MTRLSLDQVAGDDRRARMAWARLAEPGDPVVTKVVSGAGHGPALTALARGHGPLADRLGPRLAVLDVARDLEITERIGARVLVPDDPEWPTGLHDLTAPPHCLWVRGPEHLAAACERSVAVVGARSSTPYGDGVAAELASGLAERNFSVVSGAAFGIDAAAHRGALAVDGLTVAVLAGGVERAYPAAHTDLIERIREVGIVVAEVPPGSAPTRTRFLQRNRLIALMTQGTIVVEAGLRSGSLNTAHWAREFQRVVGVVPGPVTSMVSAGCHQAVRDGYAVLVTDAAEAAELVGAIGADAAPRPTVLAADAGLTESERIVLGALPYRSTSDVDDLAFATTLRAPQVLAALGGLELAGLARREGEQWRKTSLRRGTSTRRRTA